MANEVAKKDEAYKSGLSKVQETYLKSVASTMEHVGLKMNTEQTQNVMTCVQAMNAAIDKKGYKFNQISQSSITDCLEKVAVLNLNCSSIPAECYVSLRGFDMTVGVQGAGYETLVAKYGTNVKRLYQPWLVREKDDFKYPHYKGIEIDPPEWTPKGVGKVIRVVYPIAMTDNSVQYLISERADVVRNLVAHISNNLLGKENKEKKKQVIAKCEGKTLEQILADKEICMAGNVSPAWTSPQSQEQMIITKMKNNVLKNFPKTFSNTFIQTEYENASQEDEAPTAPEPEKAIDLTADTDSREEVDSDTGEVAENAPADFGSKQKEEEKPAKKEEPKQEEKHDTDDDLPF
jgi:hypothetical protein